MDTLDRSPGGSNRHPLATALGWWEWKRPWFTVGIMVVGLYAASLPEDGGSFGPFTIWHTLFELSCWAVVANACYCAGYLLDAVVYFYGRGRVRLGKLRWVVFLLGTGCTSLLFYAYASNWYFPILWWIYL